MRALLLLILLIQLLESSIVASKNIYYNKVVSIDNTKQKDIHNDDPKCKQLTLKYLKINKLQAVHYIKRGTLICLKDVKLMSKDKVVYKFGSFLEVEEYGKVITQTNKYIKIKKPDGKIKKFKKDGGL